LPDDGVVADACEDVGPGVDVCLGWPVISCEHPATSTDAATSMAIRMSLG